MKRIVSFFILLGFFTTIGAQTTRYVKPTASGTGDGSSWANASAGLQAIITASASGDQVWVAAGTYRPATNGSFSMKTGVSIYGGFAGTEALLSLRNWVTNISILQGNGVVVINNSSINSTALLDGFTITGGTATLNAGGMDNNSASPTIVNCIFKNNTTSGGWTGFGGAIVNGGGGAIHNSNSSPAITNCIFLNNSASGTGGALANYGSSNPVIINCSFYGNNASVAKCMYQNGAAVPVLKNCIVWNGSGEFANNFGNNPTITYSDVAGGFGGTGNINADPLYTDAANGNLKLSSGSPAINTGSSAEVPGGVTVDLANTTRIYGSSVDMGAYEYVPPGASLNFDGTNDYVLINNPFKTFSKEITVEFWMNTASALLPYGSIMGQGVEGQDNMANIVWLMHPNTDGTATFFVNDGGTFRTASFTIQAGGWHHIAGVASPFGTKVYVDGVLASTGAGITGTILNNASSVIHLGKDVRYALGRFGNITLDEVRVWSRALCQAEIVNNKNCETNPLTQTGLEEYYRFNQGSENGSNAAITTLTDNSGNGRDGTLTNFALTTGASSNWTSSGSTNTGTCAAYVAPTAAITGTTTVCIGSGATLSNSNAGGVWTSSNTSVATINSSTGVVASVSAGTTTITYKTECGGVSTATFTVNALPTITPATATVCAGLNTTLTGTGTAAVSNPWISSNTGVATISNIGVVSGVAAGTTTITYTNNNGCAGTATITVNTLPAITPVTASVCAGLSTTLTGTGTPAVSNPWVSSNTGTATVTALGVVTGVAAGTTTITYTNNSGCTGTSTITVNALPTVSPTTASICVGATASLTGNGTPAVANAWTSSDAAVATVTNAGVVTGISGGTATINYTNNNGCVAASSIIVKSTINFGNALNFNSNEIAGTNANLPQGNAARTIEAWIKYNTGNDMTIFQYGQKGIATNQQFVLHLYNGVYIIGLFNDIQTNYQVNDNNWHHLAVTHDGTTTVVYVDGNVIASVARSYATNGTGFQLGFSDRGSKGYYYTGNMDEVRVWNVARTQAQIRAAMNNELAGTETGLVGYYNFNQGVAGGTNTGVTTLTDKVATPHNGTLSTFPLTGSAGNWVSGYSNVVAPITGSNSVCISSTVTLANATAGGVWAISNSAVASITSGGVVTGLSAGTTTISYTVTPGVYCTNVASYTVTVKQPTTSTTNVSVCAAALPYTWNGINYAAAGTYTKTFAGGNAAGCDSVATLVLTVKQASTSTTNLSVCSNTLPYSWNGTNYAAAGTYTKTFAGGNAAGCDSVATLVLTVKQASTSTTNVSICATALPYAWNGSNYAAAGTYTKTFAGGNAAGCDSVATLVLTTKQTTSSTTNVGVCAAALPYSWNGTNYAAAGTYTKTFAGGNAAGCDSIATLVLTIKQTTTSTTNTSVCELSLPYSWNGTNYTVSGTYTKTFPGGNAAGCDSTATLVLNVTRTLTSTTNVGVCAANLPYSWNGSNYATAGTYTKSFPGGSVGGCDSVATLVLTIKQATTSTTNISVCAATLPYAWNGNNYATAGTYTARLTNAAGCDSTATLVLTIKQASTSTTNTSVCAATLPYAWNGNNYAAAGTYTATLTNAVGCDSVATLVLTVKQASTSTTNISICAAALPYSWNSNNYATAGTYTARFTNAVGCDSVATLVLTLKQASTSTTNVSICAAALPYVWNGKSYASAGNYTATLTNAVGCDSVATLVLTLKQASTSTTNVSICAAALPYSWNGKSYASAGNYTATLTNAAGCDSVATLALSLKQTSTSTTNVSICAAALPYSWNGKSYASAGNYTATLTNAAGCDSVATLALSLKQTSTSTTNVSICAAALPYSWNGKSYASAGNYTATLTNAAGCDSVATLALTLKQTSTSTTNISICAAALPYSWNGKSYASAGNYTATLTNAAGCDSVATLALTLKQTSTSTTNVSICAAALPYVWNGKNYASAGNYTANLTNAAGCDSVATLALTIKQATTSTTNVSICSTALPYSWNGKTYNAGGNYTATLTNAAGCDSVATLALTIKQVTTSTTNVSICATDLPYSWNGKTYTTGGTYTATLVNAVGCDSTASLVLTVNANPVTPTISNSRPLSFCTGDSTVLVSSSATNNQWLLNGANISGAVNAQYVTKLSGIYSVRVLNAAGCAATSANVTTTNRSTVGSGLPTHDTLICKATSVKVTASASLPATYVWTSVKTGFTSTAAQVTISAADRYNVSITLSNGCVVTDTINLKNTADTAIKAKLSVSGHAFINQTLALVNVTSPAPQSQNWILPAAASVILKTDSVVLMRFPSAGNYMVYLTNKSYNVCSSTDSAKMVITSNDSSNVVAAVPVAIRNITIGPNPTTGIMNITIELNQIGKTSLRIYDGSGTITYTKNISPTTVKFTEKVDISPAPANRTYVLVVQTKDGYEVRTIIKL